MRFENIAVQTWGRSLASWGLYPLIIFMGLGLHQILKIHISLLASTYFPIVLGAACICLAEYVMPCRRTWRPRKQDVTMDLGFMVAMQIILPRVLAATLAVSVAQILQNWQMLYLWPHEWPLMAQVILLVLLADLGRYWLHRAAHHYPLLWRWHAVHHTPERLYWLNVGRFHPVDKSLQYLFDALPFILMGVAPDVLSAYFVFYALNGFFQHCNIDLRLGILNRLISGPELHRWHHAQDPHISAHNLGNNLIIWDLIFGTYYLPSGEQVEVLGIEENEERPEMRWRDRLLNQLLHLRMVLTAYFQTRPLQKQARYPQATQAKTLMRILKQNRQTIFGRQHGFAEIHSVQAYREQVEIHDYNQLEPYILEQAETGASMLTQAVPNIYNQTSGTTGRPKYIPLPKASLKRLQQYQHIYAQVAYTAYPEAFQGQILGIVSPAVEGHLPSGQPFGSASGHIYQQMPRLAQKKYILPTEVFEIQDYDLKYYIILRLALAEVRLSYMGSANPSTFLKLLDLLDTHTEALLEDIQTGDCRGISLLPTSIQTAVRARCRPLPERAMALAQLFKSEKKPSLKSIWPDLALVSTWTQGSCQIALSALRPRLAGIPIMELGLLASEVRATVMLDALAEGGLPTLDSTFFEFVERAAWESEQPKFIGLESLQYGQEYYLFITTHTGLYRYAMHDVVRVSGFYEQTPLLVFVQKGKGITNITGEKLSEAQVIAAVNQTYAGQPPVFYLAAADVQARCYRLYIEGERGGQMPPGFAQKLELQLERLNLEYRAKRKSGRLAPLEVVPLPTGSGDAYKRYCVGQGQREGQFKLQVLQYQDDLDFYDFQVDLERRQAA